MKPESSASDAHPDDWGATAVELGLVAWIPSDGAAAPTTAPPVV